VTTNFSANTKNNGQVADGDPPKARSIRYYSKARAHKWSNFRNAPVIHELKTYCNIKRDLVF
jgi:hypothetical protein